jgi:hypothetical protein
VVAASYRQQFPDTEDVDEIEASSRSYEDEAGLHVYSLRRPWTPSLITRTPAARCACA